MLKLELLRTCRDTMDPCGHSQCFSRSLTEEGPFFLYHFFNQYQASLEIPMRLNGETHTDFKFPVNGVNGAPGPEQDQNVPAPLYLVMCLCSHAISFASL